MRSISSNLTATFLETPGSCILALDRNVVDEGRGLVGREAERAHPAVPAGDVEQVELDGPDRGAPRLDAHRAGGARQHDAAILEVELRQHGQRRHEQREHVARVRNHRAGEARTRGRRLRG